MWENESPFWAIRPVSFHFQGAIQMMIQYRIRAAVDLYESDRGGALVSMTDGKTLTLGSDAARIAKELQSGWLTEDEAVETAEDPSQVFFALIQMQKSGMLDARIIKGDDLLFSLSPSPEESALTGTIESGAAYRLNRYAYLHQQDNCLLLESPLTPCRIAVHGGCTGFVPARGWISRTTERGVFCPPSSPWESRNRPGRAVKTTPWSFGNFTTCCSTRAR